MGGEKNQCAGVPHCALEMLKRGCTQIHIWSRTLALPDSMSNDTTLPYVTSCICMHSCNLTSPPHHVAQARCRRKGEQHCNFHQVTAAFREITNYVSLGPPHATERETREGQTVKRTHFPTFKQPVRFQSLSGTPSNLKRIQGTECVPNVSFNSSPSRSDPSNGWHPLPHSLQPSPTSGQGPDHRARSCGKTVAASPPFLPSSLAHPRTHLLASRGECLTGRRAVVAMHRWTRPLPLPLLPCASRCDQRQ